MFSLAVIVALFAGVTSASVLRLDPPTAPLKDARIINGQDVADNTVYPYQLTLLNGGYHTCGAALISQYYAVTAAHCVDGGVASSYAVAGNFTDFNNPGAYFYIDVVDIIMHPSYDSGSGGFPNDIALLSLNPADTSLAIEADHSIRVVYPDEGDFANADCAISGWGTTENGGTNTMKEAEVRVLSTGECQAAWGASSIVPAHICVIGESTSNGAGACNGDSGGPLTCWVSGKPVLAGVTSWGRSGCHNNGLVEYPSVYTRISSHFDWMASACNGCMLHLTP